MIPKVLQSSENENKVSLTLQGASVIAVLYLAHQFGFDVSDNDALTLVEGLATILAGVATIYGIVRKVRNVKQL